MRVEREGRLVGAAPCYLKSHSQGEYVFDHGWADAYERAGGSYYPKLQVSVPFTPVTGPRFLIAPGEDADAAASAIVAGLRALREETQASSIHATFLRERESDQAEALGMLPRIDQQFHWINEGYGTFDDFLSALASRKRKAIKRERRDALSQGITVEHRTGAEITEADWDAFYAFYQDTGARKWGRPYLNRHFFSLIGERMADRILLVIARKDGRPIAGAINFIGDTALYGATGAAWRTIPFLHFEVCYYQAIDFALSRGLKRVEAGAQGEHKLARGYRPVAMHSAHDFADPGLGRAVGDYLKRERAAVRAPSTNTRRCRRSAAADRTTRIHEPDRPHPPLCRRADRPPARPPRPSGDRLRGGADLWYRRRASRALRHRGAPRGGQDRRGRRAPGAAGLAPDRFARRHGRPADHRGDQPPLPLDHARQDARLRA